MKRFNQKLKRSKLFQQQKTDKAKRNIPVTVAVYFLLWMVGLGLGRLFAHGVFHVLGLANVVNAVQLPAFRKLIVCGTQISIFLLWVRFVEKRPVAVLGFRTKKPFTCYITGILIGLSAISAIYLILVLTGMMTFQYSGLEDRSIFCNLAIMAAGWMIQSASEEIAIRGWFIPRLEENTSPVIAVSITAIIFGILHLFSSGVTVLSFINLILSGLFFACYAITTGTIVGACGLHFAWNFALGNIYGLPVSGFADNGVKLLQTQQIGSALFTGGEFGTEGGLVTTVVLLIAISAVWMKWNHRLRI